jgi:hypothetical protein
MSQSLSQHRDAKGFKLQFPIAGLGELTAKELKVLITRPDGTGLTKTSANGDVTIVNATTVGVAIADGDFNQSGNYQYQAFDITGGVFLPTTIGTFYVAENLVVAP